MIKLENNVFYLTAGDVCCTFRPDADGRVRPTFFGKRVEFEDDIVALGCEWGGGYESEFRLTDAEILDLKPQFSPMLNGGKTLALSFASDKGKLIKKTYITPYPRGGFSVRSVVINVGVRAAKISLAPVAAFPDGTEIVTVGADGGVLRRKPDGKTPNGRFMAAVMPDCTETHGCAYGYLFPYGNGELEYSNGRIAPCGGAVEIAGGASLELPEMLAVFSENGLGGMTRVFHDILRENTSDLGTARRPIVLFCTATGGDIAARVKAASELGCDTFAIDLAKADNAALAATATACKACGIKSGVKACPKPSDGVAEYISGLEKTIAEHGIEYVLIDLNKAGVEKYARAVTELRKKCDAVIEWGEVSEEKRYGDSLFFPFRMMRAVVDPRGGELKTKFDRATFGCLAYECDPTALGEDAKRAIRAQIFSYQDDSRITLGGDIYRVKSVDCEKCMTAVSKDKSKAYAVALARGDSPRIYFSGLDEHGLYNVRELSKTFSGAALMFCGVRLAAVKGGGAASFTLHLRQVADY